MKTTAATALMMSESALRSPESVPRSSGSESPMTASSMMPTPAPKYPP